MDRMYRCLLLLGIMLVFIPSVALSADRFELGLQVNQSSIEGLGAFERDLAQGYLKCDANALYNEDDYTLVGTAITFGDEMLAGGLSGRLGIRGVWGDFDRRGKDSALYGVPFIFGLSYDLSGLDLDYKIPVLLHAALTIGPEPLCFDDTDEYIETTAGLDWKILQNAAIIFTYRYLEADFDEPVKWQKTQSTAYAGIKFRF